MRSPPTSRAIDARSSVVVMTFSLPCAAAGVLASIARPASAAVNRAVFIWSLLERMRTVRTDGELELKQQLVGRGTQRVVGAAVLRAHLAELARPVGEDRRSARVDRRRVIRPGAAVVAGAGEPPPRELIVPGD